MFTLLVSAKQTRSLLRFFFALGPESKVVCAWQWGRYMWKCMILPTLQMLRMFGMIIISVWFLGIQSWPIPKEYDPNDSLKIHQSGRQATGHTFPALQWLQLLADLRHNEWKASRHASLSCLNLNESSHLHRIYICFSHYKPSNYWDPPWKPLLFSIVLQMVKFLRSKHGPEQRPAHVIRS